MSDDFGLPGSASDFDSIKSMRRSLQIQIAGLFSFTLRHILYAKCVNFKKELMSKIVEEQKSSLWGTLRGALFESDEERQSAPARMAKAPVVTPGAESPVLTQPQEQTVKELDEVAMSSPSPYTKLLQAAERLESFIPDEAARFKGAISVGGDLTASDVLRSIDQQHIAQLESEVADREAVLEQQMQEEFARRMTGVADLQAKAAASSEEAARIKAEFESRMEKMKQADEERHRAIAEMVRQADEQKILIEQAQSQLSASAHQVRSKLIAMREKLAGYLSA